MNHKQKEEEIIEMYKKGFTLKEVGEKFECSPETASRYIKKRGIEISNHKIQVKDEQIISYYAKCASLKKTCEHFNLCHQYVRSIILQSSEKQSLRAKNWDRRNDPKIVELYNNGLSAQEIGNMFGYCHTSIFRHLQRLGVARRKTSNRTYSGVSQNTLNRIKQSAKKRGLDFDITKKYVDDLFIKQSEKCAISGVGIKLPQNWTELSTGESTASLDRINSFKGYIKENVQWVHKKVNIMKQSMTDGEFVKWCHLISKNNS